MKKVGICGHFGFGKDLSNGQTIKTKIVTEELRKQLGKEELCLVDSHGGVKAIPRIILQSISMFRQCENILIFPAHKGLLFFAFTFNFLNAFYHRKLHYIVIGGWLDLCLEKHRWLLPILKKFEGIYVETPTMKCALEKKELNNILIMPNFKHLQILSPIDLHISVNEPYRVCTFSRVMKEKGIEDAIEAVKMANQALNRTAFCLDIYGQIDSNYVEDWNRIVQDFPGFIHYCGVVPFDQSVDTLKNYMALLFPTRYPGEGFAGTLLDAMAAGVPVIASDWRFNKDVVEPNITGILLKNCDSSKICDELLDIAANPDKWNAMKKSALAAASKYKPEIAIQPLLNSVL